MGKVLEVVKPGNSFYLAHIAQVVEHSLGKGEVTGSSPVVGTIDFWVIVIFL